MRKKIYKWITKYRVKYNRYPLVIYLSPIEYEELCSEVKSFLEVIFKDCTEKYENEFKFAGVVIKKRSIVFMGKPNA